MMSDSAFHTYISHRLTRIFRLRPLQILFIYSFHFFLCKLLQNLWRFAPIRAEMFIVSRFFCFLLFSYFWSSFQNFRNLVQKSNYILYSHGFRVLGFSIEILIKFTRIYQLTSPQIIEHLKSDAKSHTHTIMKSTIIHKFPSDNIECAFAYDRYIDRNIEHHFRWCAWDSGKNQKDIHFGWTIFISYWTNLEFSWKCFFFGGARNR